MGEIIVAVGHVGRIRRSAIHEQSHAVCIENTDYSAHTAEDRYFREVCSSLSLGEGGG